MDLRLSNEQELNARVQKFQTRCSNLENVLKEAQDQAQTELRQLKREKMLTQEKNDALQKAYDDLKQQHEDLLFGRQSELINLKQELEK